MRRVVGNIVKKFFTGVIGLSMILTSLGGGMSVAFAADITYKNDFSPDVFTWRSDSGYGDFTNEPAGGRNDSAAKRFKSTQYGNRQVDLNWDFQDFTGTTWVQFWVKAATAGQRVSIQFLDESGARVGLEQKPTLTADWQKLSYQYENFSTVKRMRFGDAGTQGGVDVLIDSVIISNVDPDLSDPGEEPPTDVVRYDEDFDAHRLFNEWKNGGATATDTDGGYSGNGKMITFPGGGTQFVSVNLPSDWSSKADSDTMWIFARIKAVDYEDSRINLQFRNASGGLIAEAKPTITKEWADYSMKFDKTGTNDIKTAVSLRFANMGNKKGSIIIDDIIICNVDPSTLPTDPPDIPDPPEEPDPEETALVNDFDPDLFTWSNGGMNAVYTGEGGLYETGGMTISYNKSNPWGFVTAKFGSGWDLSTFTKGKWFSVWVRSSSTGTSPLKLGIQFRGNNVSLGEIKAQAPAMDGKWYKVIAEIPFDITAADEIRFNNQMGETAGMFVIDDFTVTDLQPQEKPPIVPGTPAEIEPVTYVNDFDSEENKFTQKAPGGLNFSVGNGGYSGKGASIGYQGKNQYTFISQSLNASWDMSKLKGNTWIKVWIKAEPTEGAVHLADAVLEVALRNAEDSAGIANGRFTIPADNQWRELYFKVTGSLAEVSVVRFSNPMKPSSDVTIYMDDFTITNQNPQGPLKPEVRVDSVTLTQAGNPLTKLSDAAAGTVTFTVSVSNTEQKAAEVVSIVALYDKTRGLPVKTLIQEKAVSASENIVISYEAEANPNVKAVVYVWDGWQNIRPIDTAYTPKEF